MRPNLYRLLTAAAAAFLLAQAAFAREIDQKTVVVGGANAVLLRPSAPRATVILMPGGDGRIDAAPGGRIVHLSGNQLVRTRAAYVARGLAVLVLDAGSDLRSAVEYMAAIKRPVTVIATSRGTLRAAEGIAQGARPDALVLTSGFLTRESGGRENVAGILGSPQHLPRTLVIAHRHDTCRMTLPAGVAPFIRWSGGRARAVWVDGGQSEGDPCEARAHHGFNGLDGEVVALAAGFR